MMVNSARANVIRNWSFNYYHELMGQIFNDSYGDPDGKWIRLLEIKSVDEKGEYFILKTAKQTYLLEKIPTEKYEPSMCKNRSGSEYTRWDKIIKDKD